MDSAVDALLRELGPQLRRGGLPEPSLPRFPTGVDEVDRLLGGGFPRGRLSEVSGAASSGRTSLALALLARASRAGEVCAVIDVADGFDPVAAEAAGVRLERVLWARAPDLRSALRATSRVLETEGFGLVLLNRVGTPGSGTLGSGTGTLGSGDPGAAPAAAWSRLGRTAGASSAALVVLSLERSAGTSAEIALEMRATSARFTGTPPLLEALEAEARLLRHRTAPADRCVRVRLESSEAA